MMKLWKRYTHSPFNSFANFIFKKIASAAEKEKERKEKHKKGNLIPLQEGKYDKNGNLLPAYRDDFIVDDEGLVYLFSYSFY